MTRILVIEDEQAIREMIVFTLERDGYITLLAGRVDKAEKLIQEQMPDVILLDWMLPDRPGIDFLMQLKKHPQTNQIPVIFLTAKSDSHDKVQGLDAGADDYMTKPFSPNVLLARVRAVLRRSSGQMPVDEYIEIADLRLDKSNHRITVLSSAEDLDLGPTEFKILEFFMTHPNKVFTRSSMLDHVWGRSIYLEERTVDVHINRLRKILKPYEKHSLVQTIRGVGYRFSEL